MINISKTNERQLIIMDQYILFKGDIETLEYFSLEIAKTLKKHGDEVFFFDFLEEEESFCKLQEFCENTSPIAITFNFSGICGEDIFYNGNGELFWDIHNIPVLNIVVDHPFYYDKFKEVLPKNYYQISIDRDHEAYMKRFYPDIALLPFLPLGGTSIRKPPIPIKNRSTDVVFTGNYTPPHTFDKHIERLGDEYTAFYHGIIDDLISHPALSMEKAMETHLTREMGTLSKEELRSAMANMIFIDLYVRFYFRGLVIRTLADNGIKVHVYGSGWNKLECRHPENLICGGSLNSHECLQVISESKISLNVMPWFKAGAHDRIFNSQLNGAVCLTDGSTYLHEQLTDKKDCIFYSLNQSNDLPKMVSDLLANLPLMEEIAANGYQTALARHTWEKRTETLLTYVQNIRK